MSSGSNHQNAANYFLGAVGKSLSNVSTSSLTSLTTDISPSSSQFFEVLYIGKIELTNGKVSVEFIDTVLSQYREKREKFYNNQPLASILYKKKENELRILYDFNDFHIKIPDTIIVPSGRVNKNQGSTSSEYNEQTNYGANRSRAKSVSSATTNTDNGSSGLEQNRTMVFQIGHNDLRVISLDRKKILLHKRLEDVLTCIQGKNEKDYFGMVCFDQNHPNQCNGYVFKCESGSVVLELLGAVNHIRNEKNKKKKKKEPVMVCDHCPILWFQKLMRDIDASQNSKSIRGQLLKRMEELPLDEQEAVLSKLQASSSVNEMDVDCMGQNQLLLYLLKAHCEGKQSRHIHDSAENRHEFLNQYLGGGTIFVKAKRSLTNSFDHLLKRKASRDDVCVPKEMTAARSNVIKPLSSVIVPNIEQENEESTSPTGSNPRTMIDIFRKVGSSSRGLMVSTDAENETDDFETYNTSWRQNIFKNVITPKKDNGVKKKRDKSELRSLWKTAINQQILLIRMEKENANLCERQEAATMKRIKLEYDDINTDAKENTEVWEVLVNKEKMKKYDEQMLLQAVKKGVPRNKRGEVWIFLAEQYCVKMPTPMAISKFPNYYVPYGQLLKQLTSHQHAILIDLGRTFPNHSYFMSPLGPGQLALYNLLKAYSLLDPEVGYCQGLSFIAGVLLLHMSEDEAFIMLRHLMFRRNMRQRYLPDMSGLQIHLYQLTRLLKDFLPDLYAHFDQHEISPTLYAAPWILTIFASQFPLGFVVRVFDLIFVEGMEVLFKVILALLTYHKEKLLSCDGFEQIMDYCKVSIPIIDKHVLDTVIKQACSCDISKNLLEYAVEYSVLQEELSARRPEIDKLKQSEMENKRLSDKIQILNAQLELALDDRCRLENARIKHLSQLNRCESEIHSLEVTVATLGHFISSIAYSNSDIDVPTEVLRILSQLNIAERRKSLSKTSTNSEPSDDGGSIDQNVTLGLIKSLSLTSQRSNSYFAHSFDQIRQKNSGCLNADTSGGPSAISNEALKKSSSDSRSVRFGFNKIIEEGGGMDRSQSLDQATAVDAKNAALKKYKEYISENVNPDECPKKPPLKASFSDNSFKLQQPSNAHSQNQLYPLDCGDIHISYKGPTKLKTLRPSKHKHAS